MHLEICWVSDARSRFSMQEHYLEVKVRQLELKTLESFKVL